MNRLFLILLILSFGGCTALPPEGPAEPLPFERSPRPDEAPLISMVQELTESYRWKSLGAFSVMTDEDFSPNRSGFLEKIQKRFEEYTFTRVALVVDGIDFDASGKLAIVRGRWNLQSSLRGSETTENRSGAVELVFAKRVGPPPANASVWRLVRQDGDLLFGAP